MSNPDQVPSHIVVQTLKVGPTQIYFRYHGEECPYVLVLHGATRVSQQILPLVNHLPGINTIFADLRGHGGSDPGDGYRVADFVADLEPMMRRVFETRPITLVGESYGGILGLELAKLHPNVRRIVMLDTPLDTRKMAHSHHALHLTEKSDGIPSARIRGMAEDFFGYDMETRTTQHKTYHAMVNAAVCPVVMITGARKITDDRIVYPPPAYFDTDDLALITLPASRFALWEVLRGGHTLLPDVVKPVGAIIRHIVAGTPPPSEAEARRLR